jgi:hypothetical protein
MSGRWSLLVIMVVGIIIGAYARFKGLGTWPLGVDEYYLSRSIDFVLNSGLPEFPCGGYYTRGLLPQYIVAGLRLLGFSPEFAGRLVTSVASLAVLPAAYLLARRLHGSTTGMLVVTVLALSVWEVEMARFARMYAPFQAVFVWYVLFFLKFTVDGQRSALRGMVLLSVLGALTWEGGALMGLASLLPPFINHDHGRLRRSDWLYLSGMLLLFLALYVFAALDLREYSIDPAYMEAAVGDVLGPNESNGFSSFTSNGWHGGWILMALLPIGLSVMSASWLWALRGRWMAATGLASVLVLAAMHQLVASLAVFVMLLLVQLVDWREFLNRQAAWYLPALVAISLFWISFGIFSDAWLDGSTLVDLSLSDRLTNMAAKLGGFPNILENIVLPAGRAIPLLSVLLFIALAALAVRVVFRQSVQVTSISALLVLVLTMVLAIAAIDTPRMETRYFFFLYPVMLTLTIAAVAFACDRLTGDELRATVMTSLIVLLGFSATEDFQPRHLAGIDSRKANFRIDMRPAHASHYYPRRDFRGLAEWLNAEVRENDIVVSGLSPLSQYYDGVDYFFLGEGDVLYRQYSCDQGTIQRWTNLPLLYTSDALAPIVASGQRIIMLLYPDRARKFQTEADTRGWKTTVLSLPAPGIGDALIVNSNK